MATKAKGEPRTVRKKPPRPKGREKGSSNKDTKILRDMINTALSELGGVDYLIEQAHSQPVAFLSLISKLLPKAVHQKVSGEWAIQLVSEFGEASTSPEPPPDSEDSNEDNTEDDDDDFV